MIVVVVVMSIGGWAIYHTACYLVEGIGHLSVHRQKYFNATLLQYLWIFSISIIVSGGTLHFYFTKKLIKPIRDMIDSTKMVKKGEYPQPLNVSSQDEIGELLIHYNELIEQIQSNDLYRKKFMADFSHEFRTPLSNLQGYLDALRNGMITGDVELYESLHHESTRLTLLLTQFEQLQEWDNLDSQKIVKKENIDINHLIKQSVAMFELRLSEANIPIQLSVIPKSLFVQRDGIQQVISNLLDNAIRYYEGNENIILTGEIFGEVYRVSVSGQSQQIPTSEIDQIFNRFYRIDDSRSRETGGSGLGLAIAKEIVQSHGGKIGVEKVNDRNIFWFTIPL